MCVTKSSKRKSTKVFRVPVLAHSLQKASGDGLIAASTPLPKHSVEIVDAVGLALAWNVGFLEWPMTVGAHEALSMPALIQSVDAFATDWQLAVGAQAAGYAGLPSSYCTYPSLFGRGACRRLGNYGRGGS